MTLEATDPKVRARHRPRERRPRGRRALFGVPPRRGIPKLDDEDESIAPAFGNRPRLRRRAPDVALRSSAGRPARPPPPWRASSEALTHTLVQKFSAKFADTSAQVRSIIADEGLIMSLTGSVKDSDIESLEGRIRDRVLGAKSAARRYKGPVNDEWAEISAFVAEEGVRLEAEKKAQIAEKEGVPGGTRRAGGREGCEERGGEASGVGGEGRARGAAREVAGGGARQALNGRRRRTGSSTTAARRSRICTPRQGGAGGGEEEGGGGPEARARRGVPQEDGEGGGGKARQGDRDRGAQAVQRGDSSTARGAGEG